MTIPKNSILEKNPNSYKIRIENLPDIPTVHFNGHTFYRVLLVVYDTKVCLINKILSFQIPFTKKKIFSVTNTYISVNKLKYISVFNNTTVYKILFCIFISSQKTILVRSLKIFLF